MPSGQRVGPQFYYETDLHPAAEQRDASDIRYFPSHPSAAASHRAWAWDLQFIAIDYARYPGIEAPFRKAHPDESSSRGLEVYEEFESSYPERMPSHVEFWVRI